MTYASNLTTGVSPSQRDYSLRVDARRRDGEVNVGYVLFVFGVLWVVAIAASMIGFSGSLPQCEYNAAGDAVICGATASRTPVTPAGLNVSGMTIPSNLAGSNYQAF